MKRIAATLLIGAGLLYAQNSNWFVINQGSANVFLSDSLSGNPTATLFYVPAGTTVAFSALYFNVAVADGNPSHLYDIGVGQCPPNGQQVSDCSQPEAPIEVIFNLGGAGPAGAGVPITAKGPQLLAVAQGPGLLAGPGTYVLLGAGNAAAVKATGANGAALIPFQGVSGHATNGSLANPSNAGMFHTNAAGAKVPGNALMVVLH